MSTYFVNYAAGNDALDGESTGNAWKHCPGDPNAGGTPGGKTLSAGDIVVFKGGVTYEFVNPTDRIHANADGGAGNVITYRSGHKHGTPWESTRAVIDGAACTGLPNESGIIDLEDYSYLTVEGFEIKNQPTREVDVGWIGWSSTDPTKGYIIIDDILASRTNGAGIHFRGKAAIGGGPSNITIKNCNVRDSYAHILAIRFAIDTVLIENNIVDKAGDNPYGGGEPAGNPIALLSFPAYGGSDIIIRGNRLDDTGTTKNKSHILVQQVITNLTIEDNHFTGAPKYASIDHVGTLTNVIIRNNVWYDCHPTNWFAMLVFEPEKSGSSGINGLQIYNNTFVESYGSNGIIYFRKGTCTNANVFTNVDIQNNIFDSGVNTRKMISVGPNNAASGPCIELATFSIDNNIYEWGSIADPFDWNGVARTFAEWKADLAGGAIPGDANSVNADLDFINEGAADLHLAITDTDAIDQGADLSGEGFSDDKDGLTRPKGAAWDVGAYEFESPSFPSPPGGNMRFLRQSTAVSKIVGPFLNATDGVTLMDSLTVTDITCWLFKGVANSELTITAAGGGVNDMAHVAVAEYSIELTAGNTDTLGSVRLNFTEDVGGSAPFPEDFEVITQAQYDVWFGSVVQPADVTKIGGASLNTALAQIGSNVVSMDSDVITSAKIADDAIAAEHLKADAIDKIWDEVMHGTNTARQLLGILLPAFAAGKASGGGTTSVTFRDTEDGFDAIVQTVDGNGNRSAVTVNFS